MDKPMSDFDFEFMSVGYRIRDFFLPRRSILKDVGIKPGFHVLDYGCGPGSYIVPLVQLVGESGRVYALDIHPLAIRKVQKMVLGKQLTNVEVIPSDCQTGLPDNTLDAVLLYDAFHHLSEPEAVLRELHRVLKPDGVLSFSDHHMGGNQIVSAVTDSGLFRLSRKCRRTYSFLKKKLTG